MFSPLVEYFLWQRWHVSEVQFLHLLVVLVLVSYYNTVEQKAVAWLSFSSALTQLILQLANLLGDHFHLSALSTTNMRITNSD